MSKYIDADDFESVMYHEAFETDTEMQRWDSGCWIRYKLFENLLEKQPTADVVKAVQGEWIYNKTSTLWECSNCHEEEIRSTTYCPHCGARNRGGR